MKYCRPLINYPTLSDELFNELIDNYWKSYNAGNRVLNFGPTNETYTSAVQIYHMPEYLVSQLLSIYTSRMACKAFYFQKCEPDRVVPHYDPPMLKTQSPICILDPGGDNVKTIWYKPNKEYRNKKYFPATDIPYEELYVTEEHVLQKNIWYLGDFNEIHSVENIERTRIAIVPGRREIDTESVKYVIKYFNSFNQ